MVATFVTLVSGSVVRVGVLQDGDTQGGNWRATGIYIDTFAHFRWGERGEVVLARR